MFFTGQNPILVHGAVSVAEKDPNPLSVGAKMLPLFWFWGFASPRGCQRRNTKAVPSHSANGVAPATSNARPFASAQRAASARSRPGSPR